MTTPIYPCADVPEVPEAHYSRLCPCESGDWAEFEPDHLRRLAEIMRDSPEKRKARAAETEGTITMSSGYVYFGQFIDHDITRDIRKLKDAGPDVEQTLNYRTPRLDLDLLYGRDPAAVSCIYENDGERLRLDLTEKATIFAQELCPSDDDLPRKQGTAVVIDARSDENLIIAQLHVLFAKFHNVVLQLLRENPALSVGPAGGSLLAQARRFVTWHYQWIVINDFLPLIARKAVLEEIAWRGFRLFSRCYTPNDGPVALPVEFTVAAFRFGHSMVQTQYALNRYVGPVDSFEIIKMTRRGGGITRSLPASYVLDWRNFLTGTSTNMNFAQTIDTFISEFMYRLPKPSAEAYRFQTSLAIRDVGTAEPMTPSLPETTLSRGSKVRLPSGQEFAKCFGYPVIDPNKIPATDADAKVFPKGMCGRTPLWYYLLREAAIEFNPEPQIRPGKQLQKLGTMGSQIVAETLHQLLNADSDSIVHAGCGWKPPVFKFGPAGDEFSIRSLPELARFTVKATIDQANRGTRRPRNKTVGYH